MGSPARSGRSHAHARGGEYRAEIDGLRALAVIPVIFFHAGFVAFSGGYVGVDVFFVISGYLITSIIYGEIQEGSFSIGRFYERRVRRIFPALILITIICIPFAWLWMMPDEFQEFGQSVAAVNLFSSNVLFWRQSGYFSHAAELKPLLHTWSLAVEEQFYVLFPLMLLVLSRLRWACLVGAVAIMIAASLAFAEWGTRTFPGASFLLVAYSGLGTRDRGGTRTYRYQMESRGRRGDTGSLGLGDCHDLLCRLHVRRDSALSQLLGSRSSAWDRPCDCVRETRKLGRKAPQCSATATLCRLAMPSLALSRVSVMA